MIPNHETPFDRVHTVGLYELGTRQVRLTWHLAQRLILLPQAFFFFSEVAADFTNQFHQLVGVIFIRCSFAQPLPVGLFGFHSTSTLVLLDAKIGHSQP